MIGRFKKLKIQNRRVTILAMTLLCAVNINSTAYALTKFNVEDQERIDVSLSNNDINRIAVTNDRIKAIYGPQDKAHIITDEENGQIFITPKVNSKESFSVSLVTESNQTVDMNIWPVERSSETVLLSLDKRTTEEKQVENKKQEVAVKTLIKAILNDTLVKGYQVVAHELVKEKEVIKDGASTVLIKSYLGLDLNAQLYTYQNLKDKQITMSEQMFKEDKNVIAVAMTKKTLTPKEITKVVIVWKNGKR